MFMMIQWLKITSLRVRLTCLGVKRKTSNKSIVVYKSRFSVVKRKVQRDWRLLKKSIISLM
jgi:hypothetical protein